MGRGRGAAWADARQQQKNSELEIIEDAAVTVDVFRRGVDSDVSKAGFESEVSDGVHVKSIRVRIDRVKAGVDTGDNRSDFTALTDDFDVKMGDLWRQRDLDGNERWWLVTLRRPSESGSEVWLAESRKGGWQDGR